MASSTSTPISEFAEYDMLFGANSIFVEELYARYVENPASIDASWRALFDQMGDDAVTVLREARGPSWGDGKSAVIGQVSSEELAERAANQSKAGIDPKALAIASHESVRALMLIRAYRVRGHFHANLDPLGITDKLDHPELDPSAYGFSEEDMDKPIHIHGVLGYEQATLREITSILRKTYCRTIGVEFMHIQHPDQKSWIQERFEATHGDFALDSQVKKYILKDLIEVESFEEFLQVKYPGMKRFSVQGGDSMVPGMETVVITAARQGVKEIIIGMPHRGRMNVLTTVMKKPYVELFSLFHGNLDYPEWLESSGDVKYHLGASSDRQLDDGEHTVHVSLASNPSHLEAVDPVVVGKVRAKQDMIGDEERLEAMGVLLHGDAAFAGQGVVAETLSLSELKGYRTGGTIHIIVNNQIGFTTSPKHARSSPYPSDVARMVGAPIFHVNGDDPEAVCYVCQMAVEFRQQFKKDVVIDIFCYRKYGHNESDEPSFTQPIMYKAIKQHKSQARLYGERLIAEGALTEQDVNAMWEEQKKFFEGEFEAAKSYQPNEANWLKGHWSDMSRPEGDHPDADTGVEKKILEKVGKAISEHPKDIEANRKILRQLDAKRTMIETGEKIDWATGEALAFGTLLLEGHPIRMTGQDCQRGTFSQRHAVLVDQQNEQHYVPLNNIEDGQECLEIHNSNLSEFAVLGFEYGYSQTSPKALTLWEAQFGDFANGAQVIIDQFISCAEMKWLRMSGLVMLLPHGYEGQGPEHSSARLERFLRLCAQDNMQVANCSTPANYFHILRRQLHRPFRKPLVMMTPKSLLRHKLCVSTLDEMVAGTQFRPVIGEHASLAADSKIRKVVISSGKVYYDLLEARDKQGLKDVSLVRMEQFYPYPDKMLGEILKPYKNAEIIWCQEEPENMGAWAFLDRRIEGTLSRIKHKAGRPRYVGRPEAASPAAGYLKVHNREQQSLVKEALA